jgi:hypothetical protein
MSRNCDCNEDNAAAAGNADDYDNDDDIYPGDDDKYEGHCVAPAN